MSLSSAGNVHSTCLRILRARGYALRIELGDYEDDDGVYYYVAEHNGFAMTADDPIELLGLVGVYEHVQPTRDQPYWWRVEGPDIQDELIEEALERALDELKARDPSRWVREVTAAREEAQADPSTSVAERLGISAQKLLDVMNDPLLRANERE